tara:strand:- start:97 stop:435 length:339 start_codon:yes stop_codon:yes gene_type:complete
MIDQKKFNEWQNLRVTLKEAKKEKDFKKIVNICEDIIAIDKEAPFIQIMAPLFYKEKGIAYLKLGDHESALSSFELSQSGFINYRSNNELSSPDDWLKDISTLEKKINKLRK